MITIFLLLLTTIFSINENIVNIINKERVKIKIEPIVYNHTIENILYNLNKSTEWFYNTNEGYTHKMTGTSSVRRLNGDHIFKMPEYKHFASDGWDYMFRDRTFRSIGYILYFRIREKYCTPLNLCSNTTFSDYTTCCKGTIVKYPKITNSTCIVSAHKKCSWAFQYYPKIVERKMTQIACILLRDKTRKYQILGKPKAFFCYHRLMSPLENDYPLDLI